MSPSVTKMSSLGKRKKKKKKGKRKIPQYPLEGEFLPNAQEYEDAYYAM